jgi:hypothetical protein
MWYKNIRAQNILILAFSLIGIVGSIHVFTIKSDISIEERHQIETEVFSLLVNYITSYPEINYDYIFLGISGSDPAPEIMDTFHDYIPTVEPISSSIITIGLTAPVVHKSDPNKRGMQIDLDFLDKEPSGYVKVLASLYQHKLDSITYEYTLAKSGGIYRVISVRTP